MGTTVLALRGKGVSERRGLASPPASVEGRARSMGIDGGLDNTEGQGAPVRSPVATSSEVGGAMRGAAGDVPPSVGSARSSVCRRVT